MIFWISITQNIEYLILYCCILKCFDILYSCMMNFVDEFVIYFSLCEVA